MQFHDLYGTTQSNIELAKSYLEQRISLEFELHDSLYFGEYYKATNVPKSVSCTLKFNKDFLDDSLLESDYEDYPILFFVDNVTSQFSDEFKRKLNETEVLNF